MVRASAALVLALLACIAPASTQMRLGAPPGDFVELDVVVVDRKGRPVKGLSQPDFTVKDGGKPVALATFREVSGPDPDDPDSSRTIVLLLDDTGVSPPGTSTVQTIARAFVSSASRRDDVTVVRLHARDDEPFGDRIVAEERIREYRGGAWPFAYWSTSGEVLARIGTIARAIAANAAKRKIIVCVGAPFVCNVSEPRPSAPRSFESIWLSTVSDAATANVAVYALIPGRVSFRDGGLPESTGGEVFASTYDMGPPIDRILSDASNYYVLGYWPVSESKGLRRVEVKARVKGARVLARKLR